MPSIQIGPRLFDTQFKLYRHPWAAFWRELIQNAVDGNGDAGCNKIDIQILNKGNFSRVIFKDDGPGMSKNELEQKYMILGETGKDGKDTIGGFGMARILTCFAQKRYSIKSCDWMIEGCGQDWEYVNEPTDVGGFDLEIDVSRNGHDELESHLLQYLRQCRLHCKVSINGKMFNDWTFCRHLARELSFANVYTNKTKTPELFVRVNGVCMFTCYVTAPAQIIVEIPFCNAREVLQMSRDGLMGTFQNELASFINELNINKQSALRRKTCKSTVYEGVGTFVSHRKNKQVLLPFVEDNVIENVIGSESPAIPAHQVGANLVVTEEVYNGLNLFNVVIEDETENQRIKSKIDQYNPRNWDLGEAPVRFNSNGAYRRGTAMLRLLVIWKAACESCIALLQSHYGIAPDILSWGVGWVFSDDVGARHLKRNDTHFILLNPCNGRGNMRYSLSQKKDLIDLAFLAGHEICHVCHTDHDEDFASAYTKIAQLIGNNLGVMLKSMKMAKEMSLAQLRIKEVL